MTKSAPKYTQIDGAAVFPWVVTIDQREKAPYQFTGIVSDAKDDRLPMAITTRAAHLPTGDYSLFGCESRVAIERKSLADLYGTLGQQRDRFIAELQRLNQLAVAAVVVEADWNEILNSPPPRSHLPPKIVYRSVLAWQQEFPAVHWWFVPGRRLAEVTAFRVLERFWKTSLFTPDGVGESDQWRSSALPGVPAN